jgi:oligogalacturonide lyase
MSTQTDSLSGREVHRLTGKREWNTHPTYHVNGFLDDDRVVFTAQDEGATNIYTCDLRSGEIVQLTDGRGIGYLLQHIAAGRGDGKGTDAFHIAVGYRTNNVYFVEGSGVRGVNADTLEEQLLFTLPEEWVCGVVEISGDEGMVLLPLLPRECFTTRAGLEDYIRRCDHLNLTSQLVGVRTDGSGPSTLWEDKGCFVGHAMFSPVTGRYVLADRASDPDKKDIPLLWVIDVERSEAWPLQTCNPKTGHSTWLWDGSGTLTHGVVPKGEEREGAEYIQILNRDGSSRWIGYHGPPRYYGHCHITPREVIITDSIFRDDAITAVRPGLDSYTREIVCLHRTDWTGHGQMTHPHPHVSPDGRWILFGAYRNGRKDIYAVGCRDP